MHNNPPTSLTSPAASLLKDFSDLPVRLVYFTFGNDWKNAISWASSHRSVQVKHKFFIARHTEQLGELWAFKLDSGSRFIDWTQKNPAIREGADIANAPTALEQEPEAEVFRLPNQSAYTDFVDALLAEGDVVLRAAFSPAHPKFAGRAMAKCKVLASRMPCIAFDDHPEDWEILSSPHKVVTVRSPLAATETQLATNLSDEFAQFRREHQDP